MRYPNLRYGNPTEFAYYAMAYPGDNLARMLRRDERTVKDWLSGRTRVPWWVPEILRLKRMEAELRHRQMGMGKLLPRLGIVSADVISLPQRTPLLDKPIPILDSHASGEELHLRAEVVNDF
jgi:hypothetical protein